MKADFLLETLPRFRRHCRQYAEAERLSGGRTTGIPGHVLKPACRPRRNIASALIVALLPLDGRSTSRALEIRRKVATSPRDSSVHPSGISPISESTSRSGNRSAMSCGKPVSRPSIFARTGSKSTNQDLNSARAIASSVSFIRRFNSILSSRRAEDVGDGALFGEGRMGNDDTAEKPSVERRHRGANGDRPNVLPECVQTEEIGQEGPVDLTGITSHSQTPS